MVMLNYQRVAITTQIFVDIIITTNIVIASINMIIVPTHRME